MIRWKQSKPVWKLELSSPNSLTSEILRIFVSFWVFMKRILVKPLYSWLDLVIRNRSICCTYVDVSPLKTPVYRTFTFSVETQTSPLVMMNWWCYRQAAKEGKTIIPLTVGKWMTSWKHNFMKTLFTSTPLILSRCRKKLALRDKIRCLEANPSRRDSKFKSPLVIFTTLTEPFFLSGMNVTTSQVNQRGSARPLRDWTVSVLPESAYRTRLMWLLDRGVPVSPTPIEL